MAKKEEKDKMMIEFYKELGITPGSQVEISAAIYVISYEDRGTIDRTKFPKAHKTYITNKKYKTWQEAFDVCRKMEKKDKTNIYIPHTQYISKSEYKKLFKK